MPQRDNAAKLNWQQKVAWIALGVVGLFVLYVMAIGPLLWLAAHGYLPDGVRHFLSRAYEPLWIIASYVPSLKQLLHWYIAQWENRP